MKENVDEDNMQELFHKIHGELPLLEHLDFVFIQYADQNLTDKMDVYQMTHILYVFAKCAYTNSLFLQNFTEVYIKLIQTKGQLEIEKAIMRNPEMVFKLIFALSKSKNYKNEALIWRVLELQIISSDFISTLKL